MDTAVSLQQLARDKGFPLRSLADNLLRRQQDKAIAQQGYPLSEVRKIVEQPAVQQPHSLVKLQYGYGSASAGRLLARQAAGQIPGGFEPQAAC